MGTKEYIEEYFDVEDDYGFSTNAEVVQVKKYEKAGGYFGTDQKLVNFTVRFTRSELDQIYDQDENRKGGDKDKKLPDKITLIEFKGVPEDTRIPFQDPIPDDEDE